MNKKQENSASAHKELLGFVEANSVALAAIPGFVSTVAMYKGMYNVLQNKIDGQQANIKAFVLDKELKRKALMDLIVDEASKLEFLAFDQKDEPMKLRAKMHIKGLARKRDTMLVSAARVLIVELNAHLADLASYNVTAANVAALENAMKEYSEVIDEKSVAFGERVSATASIERQLQDMRQMVNRLKAMVRLQKSTELMEQFETAAKLKQLGVRHYNLSGTVVDDEDKLAIHNAQVTVYGPAGKIASVLTNENGFYHFLSLTPGDYKMVVEKVGFVEHIATFEILSKQKRLMDVELEFDNSGEAVDAETDSGLDA